LADAFFEVSSAALRQARLDGTVVACDIVWAEVVAGARDADVGVFALQRLGIEYRPVTDAAAAAAGAAWRGYRRRGGPRERVVADFLIGAHALHSADRLLTRDRGFYRAYFGALALLDPTA